MALPQSPFGSADPNQLFALLNSQQGQNLDAGSWNALRDQASYARNAAAAAAPGPYQATYYQQQPQQTMAPVTLGTGERQNVPIDQGALSQILQSYRGSTQPQWHESNAGNDYGYNPLGAQAPAAPQLTTPQQRMSWLQTQPQLRNATGPQLSGYYEQTFGIDPYSDQMRSQKNTEAAMKMQMDQQGLQKGALSQYMEGAKAFHPDATPEMIKTTYNDPAHPNQFEIPGKYIQDPLNPGQSRLTPSQLVWAQPEDVDAYLKTAPPGMSQTLSSTQNHTAFALATARRAAAMQAGNVVQGSATDQSRPYSPSVGTDTASNVNAARSNLLNWLGQSISSGAPRAAAAYANSMAWPINALSGLFGARGNVIPTQTPQTFSQQTPQGIFNRLYPQGP